jgi:hypothetical protein
MRAGGFSASPFVLCTTGFIEPKANLNNAKRQTQTMLSSSRQGRRARLRLPVSTGSMFDFILTELP